MKKPQAFIIEDNAMLSTLFEEALREAGYETETALDGQVAESRLKEFTPHLILLDLHLPYVSGAQILNQIRTEPRLDKTRIIIASADGAWSAHLDYEPDFLLNKPISYVQLRDLASRLLPTMKVD